MASDVFGFFNESYRRWEILKEKSYAGAEISSNLEGDLYLHSEIWPQCYNQCLFTKENREEYFYNKILTECDWNEMYISYLENDGVIHCKISYLLELDTDGFNKVMAEYGFALENK